MRFAWILLYMTYISSTQVKNDKEVAAAGYYRNYAVFDSSAALIRYYYKLDPIEKEFANIFQGGEIDFSSSDLKMTKHLEIEHHHKGHHH